MCGRFVSASNPEEIAAYFDAAPPQTELDPQLQRRPDDGHLRRRRGRRRQPAGRGLPLGPHPGLGQGHQDRPEDDQRPRRDGGHQGRVQGRLQAPPLPDPHGRLLRVARRSPTASPSSPTSSTGSTASRWPWPASGRRGGTGPPAPTRRLAPQLHHRDDVGQRHHGHDPRPDAGDPPGVGVGDLAGPRQPGPRRRSGSSWCPPPTPLLTLHPISTDVNKVANDDAHLIDPIDPDGGDAVRRT